MPTIHRNPARPPPAGTGASALERGGGVSASSLQGGISPRPLEAERYEARYERGRSRTLAHTHGGAAVVAEPKNPRAAAYVAEAGKPLHVVIDPALLEHYDAAKVELLYRFEGATEATRLPISDGSRDMRTGALLCLPAVLDVPEDARGTLRLSFEVTTTAGQTRSLWNPHYDAVVIPKDGATLVLDEQWHERLEGRLQAGQHLELAYDVDRLKRALGDGAGDARMTAYVSFNNEPPLALPLHLEDEGGAPRDGLAFLPAVRVPYDAHTMSVWFKAEDDGRTQWDSNLGANYTFPVELPVPDADPSWRKFVSKVSFPGLDKDSYVALAPGDEGYNCIAWSVGARDEWVWPGERVPDFDALYAKHGYRPLDDLDLSFDPTLEKVALYGHRSPSGAREVSVTHAARMDEQGHWTSKLGTEPLVRHEDARAVEGPSYGKLVRVYARPRPKGST